MASFIDFEVSVDGEDQDNEVSDNSDLESLSSFIDGNRDEQVNDVNIYQSFDKIETDINKTLQKEYEKGLKEIEDFADISNLSESSEEELEIDHFNNSEQRVEKFAETLLSETKENENEHHSLIKGILYAIRYQKE